MAITRLKRKSLRNKLNAKKRQATLKHLSFMPVIKNQAESPSREETNTANSKTSDKKKENKTEPA